MQLAVWLRCVVADEIPCDANFAFATVAMPHQRLSTFPEKCVDCCWNVFSATMNDAAAYAKLPGSVWPPTSFDRTLAAVEKSDKQTATTLQPCPFLRE